MWDEEDGFFYDVLRLPDGARKAAESALDGRAAAACAVTVFEDESSRSCRSCRERARRFLDRRPELVGKRPPCRKPRRRRSPAARRSSMKPSSAACSRGCSTKTNSSARTAFGRCRAITPSIRMSSITGGQEYRVGYVPGESDYGHVRRQLELARADLDAGQRAALSARCCNLRLLRRRLHGRVPHRLRAAHDALRWPRRSRERLSAHVPARRGRATGPSTAARDKFQDDPHWRDCSSSTNTSTATTAPASAPAIRPAGPGASRGSSRPTPSSIRACCARQARKRLRCGY